MKRKGTVLFVALVSAHLLGGGCSVGQGVGAANGSIYELGCSASGDYCVDGTCGKEGAPVPYDLHPSYFAGEPINDLRQRHPGSATMHNRLIIRMQHSGKQIELNDVLTFDVINSYEVARCVRGRIGPTGKNDWDEGNCYRASETGPGRLRIQYDGYITASLAPKATCTANLVAVGVSSAVPLSYDIAPKPSVTDGAWESWIELEQFGSAAQYALAAREREAVSTTFMVDFGERVYASAFLLTLADSTVVDAAIHDLPRPYPQVGGVLGGSASSGRFDFDLLRGRGAQFFP